MQHDLLTTPFQPHNERRPIQTQINPTCACIYENELPCLKIIAKYLKPNIYSYCQCGFTIPLEHAMYWNNILLLFLPQQTPPNFQHKHINKLAQYAYNNKNAQILLSLLQTHHTCSHNYQLTKIVTWSSYDPTMYDQFVECAQIIQ